MIETCYGNMPRKARSKYSLLDRVFIELLDAVIQCYLLDHKVWTRKRIWKAIEDYAHLINNPNKEVT